MRQRDRGSVSDSDPHGLLFGGSEADDDGELFAGDPIDEPIQGGSGGAHRPRPSRGQDRANAGQGARRRRNRRFFWLLTVLLVIVVGVAAWLVVLPIYRHFHPADYSGSGTGQVIVTVDADDTASQIGQALESGGVVASVKAFTDAADDDPNSQDIQPGSYRMRRHMSAVSALSLLESAGARINADVLVAEGATVLDVEARLVAAPCTSNSPPAGTICGAGLPKAAVAAALRNIAALGIPSDFLTGGKQPSSPEGFLFPATYFFPSTTAPTDALSQMVSKFTDQARSTDFTSRAKALGLSPYQELIIASIAQSEAKFPSDYAKVARVILNRLAQHIPLRIDATSAYAAKLKGLNPAKVIYATIDSPYNTYTHSGLPPTPVDNPGAEAMQGAAHPAAGNWLFYVNADAQGHLGFYSTEKQFEIARAKCAANHWGCA